MESSEDDRRKNTKVQWFIENFDFCWHKTGERLESRVFDINFSCLTYWRLWLYPRGVEDGEYISFYLFREEGGPEIVHVDFELFICFGSFTCEEPTKIMNWYSFKIHQKQGFARFKPRREIFASTKAQNGMFNLIIGCRIFDRERDGFGRFTQLLVTRIDAERIDGTEILDSDKDDGSDWNKDIEVSSLMEAEPLININFSYFDESLVIKIQPMSCKQIKFSTCKLTIIESSRNEPLIEHVRSWIGEIKADSWRYHVKNGNVKSFKPSFKTSTPKAFLLHYEFAFSSRIVLEKSGVEFCGKYIARVSVPWHEYFSPSMKTSNSASTALDTLKKFYEFLSLSDQNINMRTETLRASKAILAKRCQIFKHFNISTIYQNVQNSKELFLFLYTDIVEILTWRTLLILYNLSCTLQIELLKIKCRNFISDDLCPQNAVLYFSMISFIKDLPQKIAVENYILTQYNFVLCSDISEHLILCPKLIKEVILLKYKRLKRDKPTSSLI